MSKLINVHYDSDDFNDEFKINYLEKKYFKIKKKIIKNNVNDSFPMLIDRLRDDTYIAIYDDFIFEVGFNDDDLVVTYYQIYRLAKRNTKYGAIPDIVPVDIKELNFDKLALMN